MNFLWAWLRPYLDICLEDETVKIVDLVIAAVACLSLA